MDRLPGSSAPGAEAERIVPGTALWDAHLPEHLQRYAFAADRLGGGLRVLDAGCGVGYGAAALADRGALEVIAVDLSLDALNVARAQFARPQIQWIAEDCHRLEVAGRHGPYDLICNLENLEHLAEPDRFLQRCRQLLAPNGTLVTSTPNRIGVNRLRGLPEGASSPNPFHFHEYTVAEFRRLLEPHFEQVSIHVQTYDPIERMQFEPLLVALWRDPLLRIRRALGRALRRPVARLEDLLPPRRWQILDECPGDELTITQLAVCRRPRPMRE
jgi:SAM-dependent methyltransferase